MTEEDPRPDYRETRQEPPSPPAATARSRRRAEVFGDVLPESTRDDRDPASEPGADSDAWLRANVPPHHG